MTRAREEASTTAKAALRRAAERLARHHGYASAAPARPLPARRRLPNRRDSDVYEFDVEGVHYRAQVSRFPNGEPSELFLDGPKIGSAASIAAHDGAVAASLALQSGCDAETLSHALLKHPDGRSAGPIGRALDLATEQA